LVQSKGDFFAFRKGLCLMDVIVEASGDLSLEFRHFWGQVVRGFNPARHCLPCLIGARKKTIRPTMASTHKNGVALEIQEGEYFYLCGVSHTFAHRENFHLAGVIESGATASLTTFGKRSVVVHGMRAIQIDPGPAATLFQGKGREYLTCRNFQFAAQVFGNPKPGGKLRPAQLGLFDV